MIAGPTYEEMWAAPHRPPAADELDAANLFSITWRDASGGIRHEVLPTELTGVDANILVLTGREFPSGSHKVGAAYATLMEGELAGEIRPGVHTVIGPSTGNFGIGTAYVARLKGYRAMVIMPEQMSAERYQRIRRYGGELDLTPGSESDVILVLERAAEYASDVRNKVLAQFELMPNYRFHRYVTGRSALQAASQHGNGRVAAFVAAPGSAGTMAAGDEIKSRFRDAAVCALEPEECSTLFDGGSGRHRIEGIGDKMVTLIHNVLATDYVMAIHDDDCVAGLDLLECRQPLVERTLGMREGSLARLHGMFGVSGVCNILGAMRTARFLGLGRGDNVITIATDGFDRYPSVLADFAERTQVAAPEMVEAIFRGSSGVLDVRPRAQKERLFGLKREVWTRFGYKQSYLDGMQSQSFWDAEYERIPAIDEALRRARMRDRP